MTGLPESRLAHARGLIASDLPEQALPILQRLAQSQPRSAPIAESLAIALMRLGDLSKAEYYMRRAIALAPDVPAYLANLGHILNAQGRHVEAVSVLERAVARDRSSFPAQMALASACLLAQRFASAERRAGEALAVVPDSADAALTRAIALRNLGDAPGAAAILRDAAARHPDNIPIASGLAYVSNYTTEVSGADSRRLHEAFGTLLRRADPRIIDLPERNADPERRIRIGLVSADLRSHPVAAFLVPLFRHIDRSRFAIACYSNTLTPDATTEYLKSLSDLWRPVQALSPFELASLVSHDAIDNLIDLSGLTGGNSLAALRHQPAPIQATYLGYPATTGLASIAYRFVDSLTDPPESDRHCTERLIRLDPCFVCYQPPGAAPDPAPDSTSPIRFGSFNTLQKVSNEVLAIWAGVLDHTPGSSLVLKNTSFGETEVRDATAARAARAGIPPERLRLIGPTAGLHEHLAAYREVDIALDTFPYHGTTTTCEALWMGVPVVTLAGERHASRVGLSLLTAAGLPELIARNVDEYVSIAAGLARDAQRLSELRRGLRERVKASPLCDAPAFAARFGAALVNIWKDWCAAR